MYENRPLRIISIRRPSTPAHVQRNRSDFDALEQLDRLQMIQIMTNMSIYSQYLISRLQTTIVCRLTSGQYRFDENTQCPTRTVPSADNREAERLAAGSFLKANGQKRAHRRFRSARHRTITARNDVIYGGIDEALGGIRCG